MLSRYPPKKKNGKDSFTKSCCYHPTLTIFSLRHVIFLWRVSGLQWSSCWTKSWIDIFHAHIRSSVHRLFNVRNLRRQPPSCFFEAQSKHGHESVVVIIYIFANLWNKNQKKKRVLFLSNTNCKTMGSSHFCWSNPQELKNWPVHPHLFGPLCAIKCSCATWKKAPKIFGWKRLRYYSTYIYTLHFGFLWKKNIPFCRWYDEVHDDSRICHFEMLFPACPSRKKLSTPNTPLSPF